MKTIWIIIGVIAVAILIWGATTNWWRGKIGSLSVQTASPAASSSSVGQTSIEIKNMAFTPNSIEVKTGTKIVWTNNDSVSHTVTSDNNKFSSPTLSPGQTFEFTFSEAGDFSYHCSIHPNMTAKVIVQ